MKSLIAALALFALGGCADYLAVDGSGRTTAPPPKDAMITHSKGDTCHAGELQYLVGKQKDQAPPPVDPSSRRVTCSSCAVTMDYRADRLNIIFDSKTGAITQVKCG